MAFVQSLEIGKIAEGYAMNYFDKHKMEYTDVRDDVLYQKQDIDFVVTTSFNNITYEVKMNYHDARKGQPGQFFWIELEAGKNKGWWYYCKADYFLFFNYEGNGILLKNDDIFKDFVNNAIASGDHGYCGYNRIDTVSDKRFNNYIEIKNMRVYLSYIKAAGIEYQKIIRRKKKRINNESETV